MGTVQTTSSVEDLNKITGLVSTANQIDDTVNNNYIISLESEFSTLPAGATRVFWNDPLKGGSFTLNANPQPDDGVIWFNGYKRNEEFKPKHTGADVPDKTFDLFKKALYMDKYNTPVEKIFSEYGATEDDGWSNAEHLITGTKYYFSSSTGDDANDGLTPATARKSIEQALRLYKLNPGDGLLFKRGDVWSAETEFYPDYIYAINGTETDRIVISCYGIGERPKLTTIKEQFQALTWTDNGDGTWWTDTFNNPQNKIRFIWLNGDIATSSLYLNELTTASDVDYFHDYTNSRLYINKDPLTISSIKFSEEDICIKLSSASTYVTIDNLNLEGARNESLYCPSTKYVDITNCTLGKFSGKAIYGGESTKIYNNIVDCGLRYHKAPLRSNSNYPSGGYEAIILTSSPTNTMIDISYNTIKNFIHGSIIVVHDLVTPTPANTVKVHHNISFADSNLIDYAARFSTYGKHLELEVTDNIFIGATQSQFDSDKTIFKNNLYYKNQDTATTTMNTGTAITPNVVNDYGVTNSLIEGNVFYKCDDSAVRFYNSYNGASVGNIIKRNISFNSGLKPLVYAGDLTGSQIYIKTDVRTYEVSNTVIDDNILFSQETDKVMAMCSEADAYKPESFYTVEEFKTLVDTGITEVSSFERNVNIDISKYTEL